MKRMTATGLRVVRNLTPRSSDEVSGVMLAWADCERVLIVSRASAGLSE